MTLTNRLELQLRQRDHAEKNIDAEISQLKKAIEVSFSFLCKEINQNKIYFPNNSMEKYVGVTSWLLFHLIRTNYIPNSDFDKKIGIVDFFTCFTR